MTRVSGYVVRLPAAKPFGFLEGEDGRSYFLHESKFKGIWTTLSIGDAVTFGSEQVEGKDLPHAVEVTLDTTVPRRSAQPSNGRPAAYYSGPALQLTDDKRRQALEEISRWKLEAKLDDVKRYFFAVPEVDKIVTGDVSYVIGRKGTGKTALVQYISEKEDRSSPLLVTKLTFKNFPFNELYVQENNGYTRPNQYITIWKLIIYSAACKLIAKSNSCDPLIRSTINKAFPDPASDNLGTIIGKWIVGDFGINVLGTGVSAGNWFRGKKTFSLQEKVDNLESFVLKHAPPERILVLFDELDEDYKEIFENYKSSEYIDLLTSLFKAVQDVRASIIASKRSIYPVIFLRDDIYDLIQDADKNKWKDLEIKLDWSEDSIRGLLAYRLSRVLEAGEGVRFDQLWYSLFSRNPIKYSDGKKEIRSFKYIQMSTQGRPRDYINYLQECAAIELKRSAREISGQTVKDADKAYSNYLRKELVDEIHGIIGDIQKVLSIFSETRKWILSIDEFKAAYDERFARASKIPT